VTPPGTPPPPPPQLGKSANLYPVNGIVLVRLPGSDTYVPLSEAEQVPMGTTVDATQGTVELCDAHDARNTVQCANFYEGAFKIAQKRSRTPITDISLVGGDFASCNATARAASVGQRGHAARHVSHKPVRHLWGNGHGRFRTNGRASAAAVRGTFWLTEDRCDGTLTAVRRGIVAVRDFHRHRTVLVPAGHRYFAALH
jgi:hypothetical protein